MPQEVQLRSALLATLVEAEEQEGETLRQD
jgi:hypothetical protein